MFLANHSFSQSNNPQGRNEDVAVAAVNNITGSLRSLPNASTSDATFTVDTKVKDKFDKNFSGVSGQRWEANGKNFQTTFYKDAMLHYALFSKKGRLFYSVTFVPKQKLPADLNKMVKSKYSNYDVSFAAEVIAGNRDIWVLNAGNNKQMVTLRVEDGNMEVVGTKKVKAQNGSND